MVKRAASGEDETHRSGEDETCDETDETRMRMQCQYGIAFNNHKEKSIF